MGQDIGLSDHAFKSEVYDEHNLSKEMGDVLIVDKPSEEYPNGIANAEELQFNDPELYSLQYRDKGEALQRRSLHFREEDWDPLEKLAKVMAEGSTSFHWPSGSDTSSHLSNSESSSFSSKSEASSFARELSPSIYLHSSLDSTYVSASTPSSIDQSFSQAKCLHKQAISTNALGQGSEGVSNIHPPVNTDDESGLDEWLKFKVLEGNMVERECLDVGPTKEGVSHLLGREDLSLVITTGDFCHSSWVGSNDGKEGTNPGNEMSCSSDFDVSKKQGVVGLAASGLFPTTCSLPETSSYISEHSEDVVKRFTTTKTGCLRVVESSEAGSYESDVNIKVDNVYDNMASTNADDSYIEASKPAFQVKSIDSSIGLSMQRGVPDSFMQRGDSLTCPCSDENSNIGSFSLVSWEDIQKRLSSKSVKFTVHGQISNNTGLVLHPWSNEMTFLKSQSALHDELKCGKGGLNLTNKPIAAYAGQQKYETQGPYGSLKCVAKAHKNGETKDFCLNSCSELRNQDAECAFITDGCNALGEEKVSPVRKWMNPGAKSRTTHLADTLSYAYLENPVLHPSYDGCGASNLKTEARTENFQGKSFEWAFPRVIHTRSRKFGKGLITSENQTSVTSEHGISDQSHLLVTKRTGKSIGPRHGQNLERLSVSMPETKDTHPSTMAVQSRPLILEGLLHCGCKNGLPYYTFSLNKADDVLVAKKWKIDNCGRDGFDWMYTFHYGQDNNKKREKAWIARAVRDKQVYDLVGQMKVCSSLCPEFNNSGNLEHTIETEFVLFDVNREQTKESPATQMTSMEKSTHYADQFSPLGISSPNRHFYDLFSTSIASSSLTSGNGTNNLTPRHVASPKHVSKEKMIPELRLSFPSRQSFSEPGRSSTVISTPVDENATCLLNHLWPHLELAAIVISVPLSHQENVKHRPDYAVSKDIGGWGLKFLEKSSGRSKAKNIHDGQAKLPAPEVAENIKFCSDKTECSDSLPNGSSEPATSYSCDNCSLRGNNISCRRQDQRSITIVVPADVHGLPTIKSGRPSPLIERWKSGGKCDCGGWDLGCPLTILQSQTKNSGDFIEDSSKLDDFPPLDVFIQGRRADMPVLTMTAVHGDLYFLSFQSQLSALQAFSIGVAILHCRDPFMHTKVESYSVQSASRSLEFPFGKRERALSEVISASNDDIEAIIPGTQGFSISYISDPPPPPFERV